MTLNQIIFAILILLTSCSQVDTPTKSIQIQQTSIVEKTKDTLFKDSRLIIVKNPNSIDTFVKYMSLIDDTAYYVKPVDIKKKMPLDFAKYKFKKMFITATKEDVAENGVNFAGQYCIASWGCGSPCHLSAIVDLMTGKVYTGPESAFGYRFKKDSKIIIVDPPDSLGWYQLNRFCGQPKEYIWTGKVFERIINSR
jgi:hypothetical protein